MSEYNPLQMILDEVYQGASVVIIGPTLRRALEAYEAARVLIHQESAATDRETNGEVQLISRDVRTHGDQRIETFTGGRLFVGAISGESRSIRGLDPDIVVEYDLWDISEVQRDDLTGGLYAAGATKVVLSPRWRPEGAQ